MVPSETMESSAIPLRSYQSNTNFAGGSPGAHCAQWPAPVVEIEQWVHRTQIHICLIVSFNGSEITPVTGFLSLERNGYAIPAKVVCKNSLIQDEIRKQVSPKVVTLRLLGIGYESGNQHVSIEQIIAHETSA